MKTQILTTFFLLFGAFNLTGQHNYIFNGNVGTGFAQGGASSNCHNDIFGGEIDDGWSARSLSSVSNADIFGGGQDDGSANSSFASRNNSDLFAGGNDDGFALSAIGTIDHHAIWNGSDDDGFDMGQVVSVTNGDLFAGGSDDGFGQSLISGVIWTGILNKDWLMADNWSSSIVPTIGHHVTIPRLVPRFPVLYGILRVGTAGPHLYAARSIWIQSGAAIFGLDDSRIMNYGEIRVSGVLDLK